jgi:UDP-2-acetamido-2-deoxy-ribo-hexuluronate aminotransferase
MHFIDLKAQQKRIKTKIDKRLKAVLSHGKYIMGPEVFELEKKLADYVGVKHCISCSSGTDALLIPLLAKNFGPGDAILTTPFTYIATAEVISLIGATPIFIDIYPKTFNMNPDKIIDAVNEARLRGLKPRAVMPVDLFGLPARYRIIEKIALEHNLFIIEDAAQGFGGEVRGKKSGSFGDVATTSFFPAKPLGCYGDGGAIFTDNDELAEAMKSIRVHGGGVDKYDNVRVGINGRLDTIQAAILLEKFDIFKKDEIFLRNNVAEYYSKNINKDLKVPYIPNQYLSSWAQYSIIASSSQEREKIMHQLTNEKIPSMIYYRIPLHLQKVFKKLEYKYGDFPESEKIASRIFSIPMHPYLTKAQQNRIIESLNNIKI